MFRLTSLDRHKSANHPYGTGQAPLGSEVGFLVRLPSPLQDCGNVERDGDLVANEHVAAAERLVELHVEVAALERADDLQTGARVAPRVGVGALDHHFEPDLAGYAMHG